MKLYYFHTLKALWDGQGKIKMYYGMSSFKKIATVKKVHYYLFMKKLIPHETLRAPDGFCKCVIVHEGNCTSPENTCRLKTSCFYNSRQSLLRFSKINSWFFFPIFANGSKKECLLYTVNEVRNTYGGEKILNRGIIIRTGITCKKILFYMRDSACRWHIV